MASMRVKNSRIRNGSWLAVQEENFFGLLTSRTAPSFSHHRITNTAPSLSCLHDKPHKIQFNIPNCDAMWWRSARNLAFHPGSIN